MSTLTRQLHKVVEYVRHDAAPALGPGALILETTTNCNLDCPMCQRTLLGTQDGLMPDALVEKALTEFAALAGRQVYLYGLGEPLMDKRLYDIIRRTKSLGLTTIVSTNGGLLTDKHQRALLDSGVDHVIVCIDGTSDETYNYYRAGGNLEKVARNVRDFAALKKATGSPVLLAVQFIQLKRNIGETEEFLRIWNSVEGIDAVRIKQEDFGIEEHRTRDLDDGYLRINPCHMLWNGPTVVRASGQVFPCYHMAAIAPEACLGNLNTESFASMWHGPVMRALREAHARRDIDRDSPCGRCPAPRPRLAFVVASMLTDVKSTREAVYMLERVQMRFPNLITEPHQSARRSAHRPTA